MSPETWSLMLVAAAFLLLGIAISPLAWVAIRHRQSRLELQLAREMAATADRVRLLECRLEQIEKTARNEPAGEKDTLRSTGPCGPHRPRAVDGRPRRGAKTHPEAASPQPLIEVPNLAAPPNEREASIEGISQRYAAIWSLADSGASAEVIARATGQPVGQIELIQGLRRQIDASRNKHSHGPHT